MCYVTASFCARSRGSESHRHAWDKIVLFNSPTYLFLFLPLILILYWLLMTKGWGRASKLLIVCASLLFYAWSVPHHLLVLVGSIIGNYLFGAAIRRTTRGDHRRPFLGKALLVAGVSGNILLLGYFKYANFLIETLNYVVGTRFPATNIGLPLGISFFTFTQIAFLVDTHRQPESESNPLDYCLFIAFFPRVLSGPITRYGEMMTGLAPGAEKRMDYGPLAAGLFLFSLGLFKKVVLASPCAEWADSGFANAGALGFVEAWITSLSYSLQLYFDFSGYTDMALGAALMFNIRLPVNFNAPYRAANIQDFWARWHMTLSRFLRDYLYIPMGGSRFGELRTFRNILVTFLVCGLWHGAGILFVFWGFLHGLGLIVCRLWRKAHLRMNPSIGWAITFGFVNFAWVFFRARDWGNAMDVLKGMVGLHGLKLPASWASPLAFLSNRVTFTDGWLSATQGSDESILVVVGLLLIAILGQTSDRLAHNLRPRAMTALVTGFMLFVSFIYMFSMNKETPFIYFRF
jgi:alginate O-acetyltransferase complex protein AlgI